MLDEKIICNYCVYGVFMLVVFYKDIEMGEFLIVEGCCWIINVCEFNWCLCVEGYELIMVLVILKCVFGDGVKLFVGVMISVNEIC